MIFIRFKKTTLDYETHGRIRHPAFRPDFTNFENSCILKKEGNPIW
jgi:hypothetical protein